MVVTATALGLAGATPRGAEAQAQGRMLVSVRVVDTRSAHAALRAGGDLVVLPGAAPAGARRRRDLETTSVIVERCDDGADAARARPARMTIIHW